jgi:hypothetical protein
VLPVAGRGGVPANATSAVLNVTATGAAGGGYLTVYPCGSPQPLASSVNYVAAQSVANAVITQLGTNGTVCIYNFQATHVLVDVNAYVPPGSSYAPLNPMRLLDSRPGSPTGDRQFSGIGLRPAGSTLQLQVTGRGGVPSTAAAVVLNVTATGAVGAGYITVYPCGAPLPLASSLNYPAGQSVANAVISKVGVGGKVCIYNYQATHVLADVNGYFLGGSSVQSASASGTGGLVAQHAVLELPPVVKSSDRPLDYFCDLM